MSARVGLFLAVLAIAAAIGLAAILQGGDEGPRRSPGSTTGRRAGPVDVRGRGTDACSVPPGQGRMGICSPPITQPAPLRSAARRFPGEDVSNHQGCVNPTGLTFVIAKAWEWGFPDRFASCTVGNARRLGIPYGTYCFGRTNHSPTESADACVRNSAGLYDSLGIALDLETNDGHLSNQGQCDWARSFNARLRERARLRVNMTYDAPGLWPGCTSVPASVGWVADLSHGCSAKLSGLETYICQYNFHGPHGGDSDVWIKGTPREFVDAAHGPSVPEATPHARALCRELVRIRAYVRKKGDGWAAHPRRWARAKAIKRAFAKPRAVSGFPGEWTYDCRGDGTCTRVPA